jgi:pyrroloquinoline-quinone synthase
MQFFERIERVREQWNVLEHPFYQRWSRGELTREELAFYAGEYREAVVALAEATQAAAEACEPAIRAQLEEHAAEERAHVDLWDDFAAALDVPAGVEPREETRECVRAWTAAGDALEGLVTLYAIESGQPAISQTKLEGLLEHYGMTPESPATAYFELHSERDHEHAAQSRALLEERIAEADADRLVSAAERVLAGNWTLLDGVERRFGR